MALLCVALLHTSAADSLDQGRSSSAVNTFADTAISHADAAFSSFSAGLPHRLDALPHQASLFLQRNATTARLQLEGMKNTITARLNAGGGLGRGALQWVEGGAKMAQTGAKAHALAGTVPAVTNALDSTRQHLASMTQSVRNAASGN